MDSFIIIDGFALWVLLALLVIVTVCTILLGCAYINEIHLRNEIQRELDAANEDNNCITCQLAKANEKIYKLTYKTPEVE